MVLRFSHFQTCRSLSDDESDTKLFWFITRQAKKEIKLEFTTLHQGRFFWDRASLKENRHARIFHRRLDDARSSSSSECEDRSCFLFCLRRSPLYLFPFSSSWDTCFVLPFELSMETESLGFSITQIRKDSQAIDCIIEKKKKKKQMEAAPSGQCGGKTTFIILFQR